MEIARHSSRHSTQSSHARHHTASIAVVHVHEHTYLFRNMHTLPLWYAIGTLLSGLAMILWDRTPVRNDAGAHWLRIHMLLNGQLWAVQDPNGADQWGVILNGRFWNISNTVINSPFVYWPSLLSFGNKQAACILTLIACVGMITLGMLLAGRFQLLLFGAAVMPMTFLSIIYYTADAVTNAYSLLFIGLALHYAQRSKLYAHDWVILVLSSVLLGQIKATCLVLALLPLVLIPTQHGVRKLLSFLPLICAAISNALWNNHFIHQTPAQGRISSQQYATLRHDAVSDPLATLRSFITTVFAPLDTSQEKIGGQNVNVGRWMQIFVGGEHAQLNPIVVIPLLAAVLLLALYTASIVTIGRLGRWIAAAIVLTYCGLTITAMLVGWSGILGAYVTGVQTRYFIPILPIINLLMPRIVRVDRQRWFTVCCMSAILFTYIGILLAHLIPWAQFAGVQ